MSGQKVKSQAKMSEVRAKVKQKSQKSKQMSSRCQHKSQKSKQKSSRCQSKSQAKCQAIQNIFKQMWLLLNIKMIVFKSSDRLNSLKQQNLISITLISDTSSREKTFIKNSYTFMFYLSRYLPIIWFSNILDQSTNGFNLGCIVGGWRSWTFSNCVEMVEMAKTNTTMHHHKFETLTFVLTFGLDFWK